MTALLSLRGSIVTICKRALVAYSQHSKRLTSDSQQMPVHVQVQTTAKQPWRIVIDAKEPIAAPLDWATKTPDVSALDVVTATLQAANRDKVIIHYTQQNVTEAKIYANTFRLAQFLHIVLNETPLPEVEPVPPRRSFLRRLLH